MHTSAKLKQKEETTTALETLQTFGYVKTHQSVDLTAEMRTKINVNVFELNYFGVGFYLGFLLIDNRT